MERLICSLRIISYPLRKAGNFRADLQEGLDDSFRETDDSDVGKIHLNKPPYWTVVKSNLF
jgi:hypothetical protein